MIKRKGEMHLIENKQGLGVDEALRKTIGGRWYKKFDYR
ncbi:hypothetical protein T10_2648 [Trichinella papuae]|uniref:Uncharacterized protein n=1 Tax=Trichinella papuae TaxID=268474 RepID=A0A0V1LYX9_9BILA|nr:hypothetical protein T10_2648 [Trichinella papuae]